MGHLTRPLTITCLSPRDEQFRALTDEYLALRDGPPREPHGVAATRYSELFQYFLGRDPDELLDEDCATYEHALPRDATEVVVDFRATHLIVSRLPAGARAIVIKQG